jgi:mannose-6-phosphate isomerase-like protein (cupin superfamily)
MSTTHAPAQAQETPVVFDVRPWGSWHVLDVGAGYKVKRITVSPHSRLSCRRTCTVPSTGWW